MNIKPIKSEVDYQMVLEKIDRLMDAEPDTPAGDRLDVLTTLAESYENKNHPIEEPDPVEAILHRMEALEMTHKDLEPLIGTRARVLEILARKRPLTISMIRRIHQSLRIPADVLIQSYSLKAERM
ncbi:MAG: transcriptional regulator [Candidatus Omnitrophota bacterium]|jgi:HTH-type transcriptional regulator/antitoxin HigA|nr:MAG: transcriptional regulator [Candidatus Omnitrophota bacterium]